MCFQGMIRYEFSFTTKHKGYSGNDEISSKNKDHLFQILRYNFPNELRMMSLVAVVSIHFFLNFLLIFHQNFRKPLIFWCFQGDQKSALERNLSRFNLKNHWSEKPARIRKSFENINKSPVNLKGNLSKFLLKRLFRSSHRRCSVKRCF